MEQEQVKKQRISLSYDAILKNTFDLCKELTIPFFNGLFGEDIPLDASVVWLDRRTTVDGDNYNIADFYPKIGDSMYVVEVEQDSLDDNMALRIFRYSVSGAMKHSTVSSKYETTITFPSPMVVYLRSSKQTPDNLTWN